MNLKLIEAASHIRPLRMMAIIRGVRYGVNAFNQVGLSFGAYIAEGIGAPQFLYPRNAEAMILSYDVGDVSRLEGKPCWVTIDRSIVTFDSPCLI
jgi:hypothetical protein